MMLYISQFSCHAAAADLILAIYKDITAFGGVREQAFAQMLPMGYINVLTSRNLCDGKHVVVLIAFLLRLMPSGPRQRQ
jgi:hypothetical protein